MQTVEIPAYEKATSEYLTARRALGEAEVRLRDQIEAVAEQRRGLPRGPTIEDYEFTDVSSGKAVRLSELFGKTDSLIVYNMMFAPGDDAPCKMCTMWVDGYNGVMRQLSETATMVVASRAPAEKLRALRDSRGWNRLRLVSSPKEYARTIGSENEDGTQNPIMTIYRRDAEGLSLWYRASAEMPDERERGIDLLSPVWNLLDLLPEGRGDWYPTPVKV
ncbi:MAG: DUF899 family protein [Candidatus Eremiobacteraeota bacterium]|nr:DUF899 family protein [Candidatus Eremiobacteraeota bacterium]